MCVLYSPDMSVNGAKLLLNKGPPRKATIEDMSDAVAAPTIITPHALPMFRDSEVGRSTKRKREKERMDPRKSRRPELPVTGPGRGGRVGASATQHVVQNLVRDTTRDEDVRTRCSCLVQCRLCLVFGSCRYHTVRHRRDQRLSFIYLSDSVVSRAAMRLRGRADGARMRADGRARCRGRWGRYRVRGPRRPPIRADGRTGGCRCDTPKARCHPDQARAS